MNSWQTKAVTIFRSLIALVLVLILTSCVKKAVSQEPASSIPETAVVSKLATEIAEVSPPTTIQQLRQILEVYQPQVAVLTPQPNETLQDNTVKVRIQVKDLPLFKDQQLGLGPHLHVILDNEPSISVYDISQPLVLSDLSPGTHTLRVFASYPWDESFKNEGAYSETTFHIFTTTDDNSPDPTKPLLTYNSPQGTYGAQPILLDFYLTNAPLHLVARENPKDEISDWRIRCTVNGESFVFDRWQAVYLKGFKPGKNWIKLEFLDEHGNLIKNVFNSTVRLITYDPKGKDTLSKIIRGELSADQVRAIVDPNYTATIPTVEKSLETQPKEEKQPSVESQPEESAQKEPSAVTTPAPQTTVEPSPSLSPKLPEIIIESPQPESTVEPQLEVTPKPESTKIPEKAAPQTEKPGLWKYFNRRSNQKPTPQTTTIEPSPDLPPTLPEIVIESPQAETTPEPQTEITPTPEKVPPSSTLPETIDSPVPDIKSSKKIHEPHP
jgi:hypothetical protein